LSDDYEIGFGKPPKFNQWKKGQSGNPKGRPTTRSNIVRDATAILSEPVTARTPNGQTLKLNGLEAAYLALCKKGPKGHVPSLINAINIMLEVQPALDAREAEQCQTREEVIALFDKMGVNTNGL